MKRILPVLAALLLVFLSAVPGSLAESAPDAGPTATPAPLDPFPESASDIHIKEEDGGQFVTLPIDIEQGGVKLTGFKYSPEISVYEDPSIRVEYHRVEGGRTWEVVYYFADIIIKDPAQLRTAFATGGKKFNNNVKKPVRAISTKLNAVLAINGDFFAGYSRTAFVLRQGDVYRDTAEAGFDALLIDEDGDFHVVTREMDPPSVDKTQVDGKKVINAFQFGPALVIDGEPVADDVLLDQSHSPVYADPHLRNQRMCIMQIDKLHYMVLTCAHWGLTLPMFRNLAMYVSNYQAKTVYTLDGGNSCQIVFLGNKKNNVSKDAKEPERAVTDIIYFASAWQAGK